MKIVGVWSAALGLVVAVAASPLRSQSREITSTTQKSDLLPAGWKIYPMPAADSKDWLHANHSDREWRVHLSEGKVQINRIVHEASAPKKVNQELPFEIKPQKEISGWVNVVDHLPPPATGKPTTSTAGKKTKGGAPRTKASKMPMYRHEFLGHRTVLKVSDGWIVGFNAGEWGGGLYWFSPDGSRHYQLKQTIGEYDAENVCDLIEYKGNVIALQGLAHLSLDRGKVVKLTNPTAEKWNVSVLANLGSSPQICLHDEEDSWVIVTSRSILRLNASGNQEDLGQFSFVGWLYPNSIARSNDGAIYLGMRHFVARLIPDGKRYRAELLVPTDLPLFDPDPLDIVPSGL